MFSQFGEISEVVVINDRYTGRSKGFGFVTFVNEADAEKAIAEMAEKEVENRKIIVNVAKPREERSDRNGGGGGGYRNDNRNRF
jgi:RNA recognition motif-containing protein